MIYPVDSVIQPLNNWGLNKAVDNSLRAQRCIRRIGNKLLLESLPTHGKLVRKVSAARRVINTRVGFEWVGERIQRTVNAHLLFVDKNLIEDCTTFILCQKISHASIENLSNARSRKMILQSANRKKES